MQSRFPHIKVLMDYLNLYTQYREMRESIPLNLLNSFEYFKVLAEKTLSNVTKVKERLNDIVNEVNLYLCQAKDFDDWHNLIFFIREKAVLAQSYKIKDGESLLSETLHGLASIIIAHLKQDETFIKTIEDYKKKLSQIDEFIIRSTKDFQGIGIREANQSLYEILKKLAYLGDAESVNTAIRYKLFLHFKQPDAAQLEAFGCADSANHAVPLYLQSHFHEWLYHAVYQSITKRSYDDFVEYSIALYEQQKEKKLQDTFDFIDVNEHQCDIYLAPQKTMNNTASTGINEEKLLEDNSLLGLVADIKNPKRLKENSQAVSPIVSAQGMFSYRKEKPAAIEEEALLPQANKIPLPN